MDIATSIILGLLQGLTEFLPVSSSGHLVLAQHIFGDFKQPGVLFDVVLHAGTLLSVIFYFWKKIRTLSALYLKNIAIATIPAVFVGLLFKTQIEALFTNVKIVGFALIITAVLNFLIDKIKTEKKQMDTADSLFTGIAQALAIIPGISRSGSTIYTLVSRKIERKKAAEFSFLLSIPAVFGASVLEAVSHYQSATSDLSVYILGFLASFLSGIFAIKMVFRYLTHKNFKWFAIYCFLIGLLALSL